MLWGRGMAVVGRVCRRARLYETNGVGPWRLARRCVWLLRDGQGCWPGAPWAEVLSFPLDCWKAI